jgi:hypothetical protein
MGAGLDTGLSALIGRIYSSVQDTRSLHGALDALLERTEARVGLIFATGTPARPEVKSGFYGAVRTGVEEALVEYRAGLWQDDPTVRYFRAHPGARFFDTALHRDRDRHLGDAYTAWNGRHVGATHWMACHATRHGHDAFGLSLHLDTPGMAFTEGQRGVFRLLFEHFERAQWLAVRPPALDHATEAVLVVDPLARVVAASRAADALLTLGDGLCLCDGALSTGDPRQARAFRAMLESALNAVARGGAGGAMLVERASGARPLAITVDPLPDQAELAAFARGAIVRIVDPEAGPPPDAVARWRALWSLTPAETRAAAALVTHQFDLRAAAEACGITYATMRTQLAALFAKTATGSQPELMRLLTRIG